MSSDPEAMNELRLMHRRGTADYATAIAFARAAARNDWAAQVSLARGLDDTDDLLGVVIWLAQIAGHAANLTHLGAEEILDGLAQAEREQHA